MAYRYRENFATRTYYNGGLRSLIVTEALLFSSIFLYSWEHSTDFPQVLGFAKDHIGDGMVAPIIAMFARASGGNKEKFNRNRDVAIGVAFASFLEFTDLLNPKHATFDPLDLASVGIQATLFYGIDFGREKLEKRGFFEPISRPVRRALHVSDRPRYY